MKLYAYHPPIESTSFVTYQGMASLRISIRNYGEVGTLRLPIREAEAVRRLLCEPDPYMEFDTVTGALIQHKHFPADYLVNDQNEQVPTSIFNLEIE